MKDKFLFKRNKVLRAQIVFSELEIGEEFFSIKDYFDIVDIKKLRKIHVVYKKCSKLNATLISKPMGCRSRYYIGDEKQFSWNNSVIGIDRLSDALCVSRMYIYFINGEPKVSANFEEVPANAPYVIRGESFANFKGGTI